MKTLRSVSTIDSPYRVRSQRLYRTDEVLSAIGPGRFNLNGTVWTGSLAPVVDAVLAAIESMYRAPGLSLGNALHAEGVETPGLLGRTWLGDVVARIKRAAADGLDPETGTSRVVPGVRSAGDPSRAQAAQSEDVDVTPILRDIELLRGMMGTAAPDFPAVQDSIRRLRRSLDSKAPARMTDSGYRPGRKYGDGSKPISNERINDMNRRFWAEHAEQQRRTSVRDTSAAAIGAVRDEMAAFRSATTPAAQGEALNRAHRAFWGHRDTSPPAALAAGDQINERNRAFWAARLSR